MTAHKVILRWPESCRKAKPDSHVFDYDSALNVNGTLDVAYVSVAKTTAGWWFISSTSTSAARVGT
jgi:hypothetical protein